MTGAFLFPGFCDAKRLVLPAVFRRKALIETSFPPCDKAFL